MFYRVVAVVVAALLLAVGMTALAVVTAKALHQRDRAVRDGILLALAQELQSQLRQGGPDGMNEAIAAFIQDHADAVAGVEVATDSAVIVRGGAIGGDPTESRAALGPLWREYASAGEREMRGGYGRGSPPFSLRLYPSAELGQSGRIATAILTASAATAAALFILALLAARGLLDRERRMRAEAERERAEIAALAGAGLAHRIRTPLATIKGTAQLLESSTDHSSERARRVVDEAERIDGMIRRLLEFARPPEPQPEKFDAAEAVREIASRDGKIEVSGPQSLFVFADPVHLEMALEELIANARAFDDGALAVNLSLSGRDVMVEVRDHGPGLSVEPARAIQPYVTTRADGTGLGLAITDALMRANRGKLDLRNADGGGCIATLRLPEAS